MNNEFSLVCEGHPIISASPDGDEICIRVMAHLNPSICHDGRLVHLTGMKFNLGDDLYEVVEEEPVSGYPDRKCRAITGKKIPPPSDKEYLYLFNTAWTMDRNVIGNEVAIKEKTIITNVRKSFTGGFEFVVKATGEKLRCNYGWAFAENTPENIQRIAVYEQAKALYESFKRTKEQFWSEIVTLEKNDTRKTTRKVDV